MAAWCGRARLQRRSENVLSGSRCAQLCILAPAKAKRLAIHARHRTIWRCDAVRMIGEAAMKGRIAIALVFGIVSATAAAPARAFDWNGVWSGQAANGRTTEVSIAGKKVQYWRSNGQDQPLAGSSVTARSVSIKHAQGASVSMRARPDGKVDYTWRGNGQSSNMIMSRN